MDTKMEDKIYRQIETNLSNQIKENLFETGNELVVSPRSMLAGTSNEVTEKPEAYSNQTPMLSRAEYIRQAREACLRQLNAASMSNYPYSTMRSDAMEETPESIEEEKKPRALNFLKETASVEDNAKEVASFRSLMIRTICAIVLFLSFFLMDQFDVKLGKFTNDLVQEYVTGNDGLEMLEDMMVSFLD
ncbi:MAG: putative rane protein [Herbinix sp.]|jgi:hypothetical protein|nr:putative rane protein [Herbinix sp.]